MDTQEFMAAVLPPEGIYCVAAFNKGEAPVQRFGTLEKLQAEIERFNRAERNVYFALASYRAPGSRKAENAHSLRAFFIDIECDGRLAKDNTRTYGSKREGLEAIGAFLERTGLPMPWLVDSGAGIHAYWPFTEAVEVARWKTTAENLKRLCVRHGLRIDADVTADTARILRVPGSRNWNHPNEEGRNPLPCRLKHVPPATHHPFDALFSTILGALAEASTRALTEPVRKSSESTGKSLQLPGAAPTVRGEVAASSYTAAAANNVTVFKDILDRTVAGTGCAQLKYYIENATQDNMEPLWRGMLSLAKHCKDGDKAARKLSTLHPYDTKRMQAKLRGIKGPYSCDVFNRMNANVCTGCAHWQKITNPLALGRSVQVSVEPKEIHVGSEDAPPVVIRPTPPKGFSYGQNGGVYCQKQEKDAEGETFTKDVMVLPYDLFAMDILSTAEEGHLAYMMALRPEGPATVLVPCKAASSKDETIKALAGQNIIAAFGQGNDKNLYDYVRACIEHVSSNRRAVDVPTSCGWQEGKDAFVYNSRIYTPEGSQFVPTPMMRNLNMCMRPQGTLDGWRRVVDMLISKEYLDVVAMGMVGFGAPLMKMTSLNGLAFHLGSTQTGTGKTIALKLAASVWGSEQYVMNAKSTSMAQTQRTGTLGNLPLVIDEVTDKIRYEKEKEWIRGFLLSLTQGRGSDRMKGASNEERANYTIWATLALLSSNTHLVDAILGENDHAVEGEFRRFVEFTFNDKLQFSTEEMRTLSSLSSNCAVAGPLYAQWLVKNRSTAEQVMQQVYDKLTNEWQQNGDERFWMAGCAAIIAGCILASSKYANIIDVPVTAISELLHNAVRRMRDVTLSSARDSEDILNGYTREFYSSFVIVKYAPAGLESAFGSGAAVEANQVRSDIKGRIEYNREKGYVHYYIDERQMRMFCASRSYGFADFTEEIKKTARVSLVRKNMLMDTKGPDLRVRCFEIRYPIDSTSAKDLASAGQNAEAEVPVE